VVTAAFSAPLKLRLDGDALVANWRALSRLSGKAAAGAAVKANGYGLGAREVVKRLATAGCRDFFVAHWAEAAAIADLVAPNQIAVLNGISRADIAATIALGATPVLNTPEQVALWREAGGGRCHVMLDSGINRLGIGPEQVRSGLFDGLEIDILLSHLASADVDSPQNARQLATFLECSKAIPIQRRSLANSAGIMLGPDYHFDLTRPGLALYGGIARPELRDVIQQIVFPSTMVLQVRDLKLGASVGYNATHICNRDTRVGTLAIGYADGYLRGFSGVGHCIIGDIKLPLLGRVSMDLITIDLSEAPDIRAGDYVDIAYDLPQAARVSGLSQYELLTGLGTRAERVWV
jgi:alanine racemase